MKKISVEDMRRISAVVKVAEEKTNGEIVPIIVDSSSSYDDARWILGFLAVLFLVIFTKFLAVCPIKKGPI